MDAIYISGNSFKVLENRTGEFNAARRVRMDCGLDGVKYASVVSSSYSAPYTTVVIDESDLTASLTSALYGVTQTGEIGSFPDHTHDGSEGQGGALDAADLGLTFLSLPDTPATYSGSVGQFIRVNSTASGVEFSTVSGTDDHSHSAYSPAGHTHLDYVSWDFGVDTISGTGDIYCNDIYTASGTVYIGDVQLTTSGGQLLVAGQVYTDGADGADGADAPTTFSGLEDTPDIYTDGNYLRMTALGVTTISGIILEAPNGSDWLLQVTNSGILYTTEVV